MDLKHIKHALALAEARNFARAAEKVFLSQPALSRSIKAREDEIGIRLFDRNSRNVMVTAAGVQFLDRAARLIFDAHCLTRDMALLARTEIGDVAFGAVTPLQEYPILPIIRI